MTTCVWKKPGILACDRQATGDGTRQRAACKMQRIGDKAYVVVGNLALGLATIEWIAAGGTDCGEPCPLVHIFTDNDNETSIVEMDLITGRCRSWETPGYPIVVEDSLYATGSGGSIALGAMAAGATAEEAVKIAAAWDDGTGFGVQVAKSAAWKEKEADER